MEMCRACLSTEHLMQMDATSFENYQKLINVDILKLCNNKPSYICHRCLDTVNMFVTFQEKCIASEIVLQETYSHIKSENILPLTIEDHTSIKTEIKIEQEDESYEAEYLTLEDTTSDPNDDLSKKTRRSRRKPKANTTFKIEKVGKRVRKKKIPCTEKEKKIIDGFSCGLCDVVLEDKDNLGKHLEQHRNDEKCGLCQLKAQNWQHILAHRLTHVGWKHRICHLCPKKCIAPLYMECHYLKNHSNEPFTGMKCNICQDVFQTAKLLQRHTFNIHSNLEYVCDHCSKSYNNKDYLRRHIITTHLNFRPPQSFVCDLCGFSCKIKQGLKQHVLRNHTEVKFNCKECSQVFVSEARLNKHLRKCLVKGICPVCGKEYNSAGRLSRHMVRHEAGRRYKCERCPATYRTAPALKVHRDKHDGNPTKQCPYCQRRFYAASTLIKHVRTHTGEKPYVCRVCSRGFTANHNLKVHMRVHGEHNLIVKRVKDDDKLQ